MMKDEFEWIDNVGNLVVIEYNYTNEGSYYTVQPTGAYMNITGLAVNGDEIIVNLDIDDFDIFYLKETIEEELMSRTPYEDR